MAGPKIIPLIENRSAAETDDKCGMRYWFYQLEGGKGIVPKKEALALTIGKETHEDLARIAEMADIREEALAEVVTDLLAPMRGEDAGYREPMELLYRRLGWFIAFALFVEPRIRAEWDDIGIEKDIILDRGELWVPTTPDRVLRHRKHPTTIVYQEYKSTISAGSKWQQSWRYQIQLHIGLKAIEEELGIKPSFARIVGLLKGDYRDGRMVHPYVWAYYSAKMNKWSHEYKTGSDWTHMPTWEYPGGIVAWVKFCGQEVALSQFPHSVPVFLDERMLNDWIRRRTDRQRTISAVKDRCRTDLEWRGLHFERRTNQCRPAFGDLCPYLLPCWNATAELDPLSTGDYEVRKPHHEIEVSGIE